MDTTQHTSIEILNALLRSELAAVETYTVALHDRSAFSGKAELSLCQRSHETRAAILRDKVAALGGQPAASPGLSGLWDMTVEKGAAAIGPEMAIRALEQGEDHVRRGYKRGMSKVGPDICSFLERQLLPEEEYTHRTMSDLKHRLASA